MIRVRYDHQVFCLQEYGGISRYFAVLSNYLKDNPAYDHKLKLLYSRNGYLSPRNSILNKNIGEFWLKKESRYYNKNQSYAAFINSLNKFDVFHPTYYDPYFLSNVKKPFVITVHDMIHEIFPEYFSPHDKIRLYKKTLLEKADHIIAISESTKRDIQTILKIPERKISVIYHGLFNNVLAKKQIVKPIVPIDDRYILFVGSRGGYKNFNRFVIAVSQLLYDHPDLNIICAGGSGFSLEEVKELDRLKISNRFKQITASEEQLNTLYQNALFFIYPSQYEGFGLPILEAFANDCPVAVSNTSSLMEVGGGAVAYFDPYNIDEIRFAMEKLLDNNSYRKELIDLGKKQLKYFNTENCMQQTTDIYKMLV